MGGVSLPGSARLSSFMLITKLLYLSFFTFTEPLAEGTTDEFRKFTWALPGLKENIIKANVRVKRKIFERFKNADGFI
jgi:hypothetical protein